ncbi:MAG: segregation ATPase FtsK/SpoIIIE, family [Frankiaceae bacterium]|jgi:hypothetical protein|nr:segregation ATPase FtsK/SpoIIIE, family [Frankiaceae bacterium]
MATWQDPPRPGGPYGHRDDRRQPPRAAGDGLLEEIMDMILEMLGLLAKAAGQFWRELAVVAVPAALACALRFRAGWEWPAAGAAAGGLLAVVLGIRPLRRLLSGWLYRGRVRRRVGIALRRIDAPAFRIALPWLRKVGRVPCGDQVRVTLPAGSRQADMEAAADALATALHVRAVRVERDRDDAAQVTLTVVRRDPFATSPGAWPNEGAATCSLWEPVPVGVGEDGQVVTVTLPERNVLVGGEPGAGKSVALSLLIATAALDPETRLWLLDGKQVELACWSALAEASAGPDMTEACDLLARVRSVMDERYRLLLAQRRRKVQRGDGLGLHVVVCDELAFYLTHPDRKARAEFTDLLRDLVARGRAAGVIVLAATQKPAAEVVPTSLRDLFAIRWALRCTTPHASDTILGSGWASEGCSASVIDPAQRGVGWLLAEGGLPVLARTFLLDDAACDRIAERAETLRAAS